MSETLKLTLPFSGKKVVVTMPEWGLNREIKREVNLQKLDPEDATALMFAKCITVDGAPVEGAHMGFEKWAQKDYLFLVDAYNAWGSPEEVKNESPTGR